MIKNAEALLNEPGAIMPAVSEDPRMGTVKSRHGKVPLIVKPLKTGHQLGCQCTAVYKAIGMCQDTIAVATDLQCLPEYLEEIRRKHMRKKGPGVNLATVFNSRRTPKEQGMKPNEVQKVCRRKRHQQMQSWVPTSHVSASRQSATDTQVNQAKQVLSDAWYNYGQGISSAVIVDEQ